MQIGYSRFGARPEAGQLADSPAAALWYLLDGELHISAEGRAIRQSSFPLFRLAALLHHWQAYRPARLDESRLGLEEFGAETALVIRRQAPGVSLAWEAAGRAPATLTVLDTEFTRAAQAFLQQFRTDVQQQLGLDVQPLYRGIPF